MTRYIQGSDRSQVTLLPECLDDFVAEDNTVRVVDAFIGELDLAYLGFEGAVPALTGRPSYHPSVLLKLYLYGYLNRIQSSRRLERECQRNVELMWLTGRLAPASSGHWHRRYMGEYDWNDRIAWSPRLSRVRIRSKVGGSC